MGHQNGISIGPVFRGPSGSPFLGVSTMRALTRVRALVPALSAILVAVACGNGASSNAGAALIVAVWSGHEQASVMAVLNPFEDQTGNKVAYEAPPDHDA